MTDLPRGWAKTKLSSICEINPRVDKSAFAPDMIVSFVPMSAVEAETGRIDVSETRTFAQVRQGYTPFRNGDVLFAKITPCMENGKMAIVPKMVSEHGFGSTEFHVLRPAKGIDSKYIYHAVSNQGFRYHAEHNMTGAVGQKRVPASVLENHVLGLPPTNEQRRIVEKIEAMFDEIDKGVESLQTARTALGLYRQSLLKSAFEGRLTADWRAQNADKLESPETLLARIRQEREDRYKAALDDWQTALAAWRANGEKGKKPAKPKRPAWPDKFDFSELQELPDSWAYLPFEALAWSVRNGISAKPDEKGPLKIFRISAVRSMAFDLEDFRRITDPDGSFEDYRLTYGDLVFTRYNGSRDYVGVSAMYRGDGNHVYPDKLIRCEIKSDILNPAFLEAATNCGESRAYIERRIRTTAGQSGVSGSDIKAMPVPICTPAEQAEITRILNARLGAAARLEAEIDAALTRSGALRQSTLKKAFSGRLVPQDPEDEPASALLERIKADHAKAPKAKQKRKANA
nr:restriction endonuclease subunit S [uncultured Roseovarius sp.]